MHRIDGSDVIVLRSQVVDTFILTAKKMLSSHSTGSVDARFSNPTASRSDSHMPGQRHAVDVEVQVSLYYDEKRFVTFAMTMQS